MNFILIEDNEDDYIILREFINESFTMNANKIDWFESFEKALNALRGDDPYDILFLDLSLPDSKGIIAVTRIKQIRKDLPVIILTGHEDDRTALSSISLGASDYLVKGKINPEYLKQSVLYSLQRAKKLSELDSVMRKTSSELQSSRELYQTIVENLPEGAIFLYDQSLRILAAGGDLNDEVFRVAVPTNRQIHTLLEHPSEDRDDSNYQRFKNVFTGEKYRFEANKGNVILSIVVRALGAQEDETGRMRSQAVAIFHNITAQKKAENELVNGMHAMEELIDLRARMVQMFSHQIRTPITSIVSAVDILEKYSHRLNDMQKEVQYVKIRESSRSLTEMIDDVLFLSTEPEKKLEKQNEEQIVNPVDILKSLIQEWSGIYSSRKFLIGGVKSLELNHHYSVNPVHLNKVFALILSNSIRYSKEDSVIEFRIVEDINNLMIHICDEGIGVPEEDRDGIFRMFYRGSNVRNMDGAGLGLTIAQSIARSYGGDVLYKDRNGKGSCFSIILPVYRKQLSSRSPELIRNDRLAVID